MNNRGPNGRDGQPLWPTTVEAYSPCATAAGPTTVAYDDRHGHDGWRSNSRGPRRLGQQSRAQRAGRPAAVAHGG
jgi:hypothetical protein